MGESEIEVQSAQNKKLSDDDVLLQIVFRWCPLLTLNSSMKKFTALKIRKNLTPLEAEAGLLRLAKSNPCCLHIEESRSLLPDLLFHLKKNKESEIIAAFIKQEFISPPLELLWIFEEEKLLKFSTFMFFHPEYCSTLNFFSYKALRGEIESKELLIKMLTTIVNLRSNNDFKFLYHEVVDNLASEAVKSLESDSLKWDYFTDLKKQEGEGLLEHGLADLALLQLGKLLNSESESMELSFVLGHHGRLWTSERIPEESKAFLTGVLSALEPTTVISEVDSTICQGSFPWRNVLSVISMFIKDHKNAELMKGKVDKWFMSGLEEKDKSLLLTGLIVGRHCCAEKARYFVSYPTWFGGLASLRAAQSFSFLFTSLAELVPQEPPLYLKIHLNKVPSAPSSCQGVLQDYLALAKTRLADLNETTDYIGLFNDYHETDEEGQESDVRRAIKLYQDTKEIPKPLLEASVFRRQYYEKVFLKRLLSVPEVEEPERGELIRKLQSAGKIPSALYRAWSSRSLQFT